MTKLNVMERLNKCKIVQLQKISILSPTPPPPLPPPKRKDWNFLGMGKLQKPPPITDFIFDFWAFSECCNLK